MNHVVWIGGPPAAGKTTVARRLARRYGTRLYSADTQTWAHRDRAHAARHPDALRWESLTPAERWERSTVTEMLEMTLHPERGQMVIDDLQALPDAPLTIAEGSVLPASAASTGAARRSHMVWLLPTAEFQDARLAAAGTARGHALLARRLREVIRREAGEHDVPTLIVDGSLDAPALVGAVDLLLGGVLVRGPVAATPGERRRLLREMNLAVVAQVRGYHARPWAAGEPDDVTQWFVCECGDPTCDVEMALSVGDVSAGPTLAPGHGRKERAKARDRAT